MKVLITGWEEGFKKVTFNQLLRKLYGYNIRESKQIVDKILRNELVVLQVDDFSAFEERVSGIGIIYKPAPET